MMKYFNGKWEEIPENYVVTICVPEGSSPWVKVELGESRRLNLDDETGHGWNKYFVCHAFAMFGYDDHNAIFTHWLVDEPLDAVVQSWINDGEAKFDSWNEFDLELHDDGYLVTVTRENVGPFNNVDTDWLDGVPRWSFLSNEERRKIYDWLRHLDACAKSDF